MKKIQLFIAVCLTTLLFFSCKKDSFITSPDARLTLSADTLKFDTVFVSTGSTTQSFKIFNANDQKLLLSKLKLMGAATSAFRININGAATTEANNIEVAANDSIYVFVTVTVDPTTGNLPFILSDSILINYNGNDRFVQLQAFGQNAHFLRDQVISTNTIWSNDLPYVILGGIHVNANTNLVINEGCKIYSHADAPFFIDGTLTVNGVKGNEVQFAGDRLDEPYRYFPSGWPGIYFSSTSINNEITYAIIKNAYQAIVVREPATNANPKLILHQSIIDNSYDAGLICINSSVQADNSLISNCGKNINISLGGNYTFSNCTVATYSNTYILHKWPVLTVTNAADQNGTVITEALDAYFINCIFWGDDGIIADEIEVLKEGIDPFNVTFDHCLYKSLNDPPNSILNTVLVNQDPAFDSIDVFHNYYDFRISKEPFAPGIDQGTTTPFPKDLDNNDRVITLPDLGSYEKQ